MEKLLKYFIEDTSKKIDEVNSDIHEINRKLDDLMKFKIEMLASAKMTSILVSGAISLASLIITYFSVRR